MTHILMPAKPGVIRPKRCETCGCAIKAALDPSGVLFECHRDPPLPPYAPMQAANGVQFAAGPGIFPLVLPDSFCVDGWRPKGEIAGMAN